jgi:hypothetical protein
MRSSFFFKTCKIRKITHLFFYHKVPKRTSILFYFLRTLRGYIETGYFWLLPYNEVDFIVD